MNHIEVHILGFVAKPIRVFNELGPLLPGARLIFDPIRSFDREIQFYLGYLGILRPLSGAGLKFIIPRYPVATRPSTRLTPSIWRWPTCVSQRLRRSSPTISS